MIPESSSLVADILLKRIETEKTKFEERYADLDILEQNITEKDYHFPSLEKPLREKFEQFKQKIFKEVRDRNLGEIQAPSAIKREITGARYGSDLIKQLYQKYGTKGLRIVLQSPPETYNELTDLSSCILHPALSPIQPPPTHDKTSSTSLYPVRA